MGKGNHEMVNKLTQQIGTVLNPLIQNNNQSLLLFTIIYFIVFVFCCFLLWSKILLVEFAS